MTIRIDRGYPVGKACWHRTLQVGRVLVTVKVFPTAEWSFKESIIWQGYDLSLGRLVLGFSRL